jgi:hypothetical protein
MRLDHVSYVASHDQISDVVNRIGSQIGTAFVDGGIHPKFGTRNFTAPLLNGQYIEIVCPLDHPATDATPFGQAVKKKADAGGGWLTWVFSTDNLSIIEQSFSRQSVFANRVLPNGDELKWKQIGVSEIINSNELPFFIEWLTPNHPSKTNLPTANINKITLAGIGKALESKYREDIYAAVELVEIEFLSAEDEFSRGIVSVDFNTTKGLVQIN